MRVRGRTVTCALLCLWCVSYLHGRDAEQIQPAAVSSSSAGAAAAPPSAPVASEAAAAEKEEEEEEWEAEALLDALNSTQLRERLRQHRERGSLNPTLWRLNRKKVTELTAITSVKEGKAGGAGAGGAADASDEASTQSDGLVSAPRTAMQWLADRWSGARTEPSVAQRHVAAAAKYGGTDGGASRSSDEARAERKRRWLAHSTPHLCRRLRAAHGVVPGQTWGSLPAGQRRVWQTLQCDAVVARDAAGGQHERTAAARAPDAPAATAAASVAPAGGGGGGGGGDGEEALSPEDECGEMASAHGVVSGSSWGTLPEALQIRWAQLACDRRPAQPTRARQARGIPPPTADSWTTERNGGYPTVPRRARAHTQSGRSARSGSPCLDMQLRHGVRVGKDWGTLPLESQRKWTRLGCDSVVNR
jgi:hypothetical protein